MSKPVIAAFDLLRFHTRYEVAQRQMGYDLEARALLRLMRMPGPPWPVAALARVLNMTPRVVSDRLRKLEASGMTRRVEGGWELCEGVADRVIQSHIETVRIVTLEGATYSEALRDYAEASGVARVERDPVTHIFKDPLGFDVDYDR